MLYQVVVQATEPVLGATLQIPYLPAGLWAVVTAMSLVVVFVALGIYLWYERFVKALLGEAATAADLAAQKVQLEAEVEQCRNWLNSNKEELLRLDAERQQQELLRQELANLSMQLAQNEQTVTDLRREVGELQNVVSALVQDRDRLTAERDRLSVEKANLERERAAAEEARQRAVTAAEQTQEEMRNLIERLKEERDRLSDTSQHVVASEMKQQALIHEITALTNRRFDLQRELSLLDAERQQQEILRKQLHDLQGECALLEQRVDDLKKEVDKLQNIVSTLVQYRDRLTAERASLEQEKVTAQEARQRAVTAARQAQEEMQALVERCGADGQRLDSLLREIHDKEIKLQRLSHEITELQGETDVTDMDRYADLFEIPVQCLSEGVFPDGKIENLDELAALSELEQNLRAEGLIFPPRILKAFHTSLKIGRINPLTVLAGVSGTGKSILPIRYAEAMGIHSLNIAVQPRWDSPQDLFGFYNYLEHKYKATELSRALVRMDKYNFDPRNFMALMGQKRLERMLLVLLDEMNLARIEYYFSEFLSKLEIRRQIDNPDKPEWRASAEFELETGPRGTGNNSSRLWVGENILFVGTMNEDETTQTPSDKVLDRANVLRFARPPEGGFAAGDNGGGRIPRTRKYLPFSEWQRWVKRPATTGNRWDRDINSWIDKINGALDRIGRPFGYRVQQAIREYILNYPGVEERDAYKIAFADQVEQKVLPKLRGTDLHESADALNDVQDILVDLRDEELLTAFQRSREDASSGMFIWRGVTRSI